jgi:hypothetical protein
VVTNLHLLLNTPISKYSLIINGFTHHTIVYISIITAAMVPVCAEINNNTVVVLSNIGEFLNECHRLGMIEAEKRPIA